METEENEAEVFAAFEPKSKDFKLIQDDFMHYMDRLKEDIDRRAEKFEYIEFLDASLRDTNFKEYAVASGRVNRLDARRMPLAAVNPFFRRNIRVASSTFYRRHYLRTYVNQSAQNSEGCFGRIKRKQRSRG
ncbi:MAG: hypothetical protein IPL24_16060 [Bacteroidetes bacterium]|nr:hypothetical protein [Bacteroidota bacterium]